MTQILLVEDSQVQAIVTQRVLANAGYAVDHVPSVEKAIDSCYQRMPQLIISDQILGEVSGLELCRRIKNDPSLSVIPVLILTGSQAQKNHVAALDAGADAFLTKDSTPEDLLAIIGSLLQSPTNIPTLIGQSEDLGKGSLRTRILTVDDSPTFLATLSQKFTIAGFEVTAAASGSEGLQLLDQHTFDVVVTDVLMPEMDGFEFTTKARQWAQQRNQQLGLLVLTGSERRDVLIQAMESGADDYVNKSQDMDVIVAHTTALARRIARAQQIEFMNERTLRTELELREAELKRQQAEERASLADELGRSNHALEESNEQLKNFAYVASHDLQAPLRQVLSFSELLKTTAAEKLDPDSIEYIDFITESVLSMQTLISDLLSYSRVEASNQPPEPTDCSTVLKQVLSNLQMTIEETSTEVTSEELPTVPGHRTQLVQLFQNLIFNAIHYRSDHQPTIHISAKSNGNHWEFSVRDNGIGIAPEKCEHVFMMFKRLHGAERSGTGIGLATCQKNCGTPPWSNLGRIPTRAR